MKARKHLWKAALVVGLLQFSSCWLVVQWQQFHGDPANRGMTAVNTNSPPKDGWKLNLGQGIAFSNPVLDSQGNIFVTTSSQLHKVSPAGTLIWTKEFAPAVPLTSPAVGPNDSVYVVLTTRLNTKEYWNELRCLLPNGNESWSRNFGVQQEMFTTSAPKVWGSASLFHVFIRLRQTLYAFSSDGRMVESGRISNHCTVIKGTSWFMDVLETVWNALKAGWDFIMHGVNMDVNAISFFDTEKWPDPTLAIFSSDSLNMKSSPMIVTADLCGMTAFTWDPAQETLATLWTHNHGEDSLLTSPVVSKTGVLAVVRQDGSKGVVEFFDLLSNPNTPAKLGEFQIPDEHLGSPVASWLGLNFYVASRRSLYMINSAGSLLATASLAGETLAPPALSLTAVLVSTTAGLEGFDTVLQHRWLCVFLGGGLSSPAIGSDGSIYTLAVDGDLFGYR